MKFIIYKIKIINKSYKFFKLNNKNKIKNNNKYYIAFFRAIEINFIIEKFKMINLSNKFFQLNNKNIIFNNQYLIWVFLYIKMSCKIIQIYLENNLKKINQNLNNLSNKKKEIIN